MQEELKVVIKRIMDMYYIAQKEGLLGLESYILQEPDFSEKHFVTKAVEYICNGIHSQKIEMLLQNRIHMEKDLQRRWYKRIYKDGLLCIQQGEHILYLKEVLLSLLPESHEERAAGYIEELMKKESGKNLAEKNRWLPDKFASARMELTGELKNEVEDFELQLLLTTSPTELQNWLRQMEVFDVCSLLLVGNEEFREMILSNMSSKLQIMVMENVIERAKNIHSTYEEEIESIRRALLQGRKFVGV